MKGFIETGDIDPLLVNIIEELNSKGFVTMGSCQDHRGRRGYITFVKELQPEAMTEITDILRAYGIQEIKVSSPSSLSPFWEIGFAQLD